MSKTIYVIGGTNGVGKSTVAQELIMEGIPYINADTVAKEIAGGKQASNRHYELAHMFCTAQIKNLMAAGKSFALENNMHEEFSYQWLKDAMQNDGYRIELAYIGVEDLDFTTKRIEERVKRGDHFVPPNQVYDRFEKQFNYFSSIIKCQMN